MEISRRQLLVGGGVLGAAGAPPVASPASAKALWT
jgi:TAT (twin-arginine translocation) pathway signal sequence